MVSSINWQYENLFLLSWVRTYTCAVKGMKQAQLSSEELALKLTRMDFQVCVYLQIVGYNIISTLLHISWQSKLSSWIYILHGIGKISGSERVKSVKSVKSVFDLVAQALGWKRCSFHMKDTFQVLPALQVSKYHSITESKYHSVKVSKYYRIKDITCTPHECLMFSQIYKSPEKLRRYSPTKENLVNQHQSSSIGSPVYVL